MIFTPGPLPGWLALEAVVDVLYLEVMATCTSASKLPLACGYSSQKFSLVRAAFDALVP
jgi:hypothetical protein